MKFEPAFENRFKRAFKTVTHGGSNVITEKMQAKVSHWCLETRR